MNPELLVAVEIFNGKLDIAFIGAAVHLMCSAHIVILKGDCILINRADISRQRIGNGRLLLTALLGRLRRGFSGRGFRGGAFSG